MNRDAELDLWLERVSTFDRQYAKQLSELAAVDDLDALDAPLHELSEQECLALVAGVDAKLTSLKASDRTPAHLSHHNPASAPRTTRAALTLTSAQKWSVAAAALSLAAGLVLVFSDRLTLRSEPGLPDYVLHPPHADASYRGTEPHVAVQGSLPPNYTIGRPLEFILQPSRRSELDPQVWAFDARSPGQPLPGLETGSNDGGGVWVKLPTADRDVGVQPGATEIVFILGTPDSTAPNVEVVTGAAALPTGLRRLTFHLRWVTTDPSELPEGPLPHHVPLPGNETAR